MKTKENPMVEALRTTGPLYLKSGRKNSYREAFHSGQGASSKEPTFDPSIGTRGGHRCCGSRVWWRHKVGCKHSTAGAPDDLSDLKDI